MQEPPWEVYCWKSSARPLDYEEKRAAFVGYDGLQLVVWTANSNYLKLLQNAAGKEKNYRYLLREWRCYWGIKVQPLKAK